MSDILNLNGGVHKDESITGIQYHTYNPYTPSFNYNDEIRISIQQQDLYVLPNESYLFIEGETKRKNANDTTELPNLARFFAAFIFEDIRYEINGFEIDRCKNVGITGCMKGYTSTPPNSHELYLSTWAELGKASESTFNCVLPLKMFLGFCEDHKKIIMNTKHELILVRKRNDVDCFDGNDNLKILVHKIQWKMPHVNVSDSTKLTLLKNIEHKRTIPIAFRSWELYEYPALPPTDKHVWSVKTSSHLNKPRFVIVGFQSNRSNNHKLSTSTFDHCNISDIKLHLNSESYPYENMNLNFEQNVHTIAYMNFSKFQESYYHRQRTGGTAFSFDDFKKFAAVFVIDCSRQNESVKSSMVDVRLEFTSRKNFPPNTTAYCLIIHENIVTYNPYTNVMNRTI